MKPIAVITPIILAAFTKYWKAKTGVDVTIN